MQTYSGDPTDSAKDAVRFHLGDISAPWEFSDEEIAYLLTQHGNPLMAASLGARRLAAKYAGSVDTSVGSLSISASQKATQYGDLAAELERLARSRPAAPWAAITKSRIETYQDDSEQVNSQGVQLGIMRNPERIGPDASPDNLTDDLT